jgi:hypothetical protein
LTRDFAAQGQGYQLEGADLNIAYPRDRISSAKALALMRHLRHTQDRGQGTVAEALALSAWPLHKDRSYHLI